MVHVEAHERQELVGDVRGERGDEHQHDARDRVGDGGQVGLDRGRDLPDRDEEDHDEDELGEDEGDDEGRPFGEPSLGRIPCRPGQGDRPEHDGDQQQGFADEQREPHDRRRADSESGEEDRQDRADTGSGDVDGGQACGEEPDLGPHPFHRVAGGLDDPDRELVGHFQQQRGQRDDQERSEHALGETEGGTVEGGRVAV
ncbi:MAG: hypothetical protein DI610_07325, partial [Staphylococcus hominis]